MKRRILFFPTDTCSLRPIVFLPEDVSRMYMYERSGVVLLPEPQKEIFTIDFEGLIVHMVMKMVRYRYNDMIVIAPPRVFWHLHALLRTCDKEAYAPFAEVVFDHIAYGGVCYPVSADPKNPRNIFFPAMYRDAA